MQNRYLGAVYEAVNLHIFASDFSLGYVMLVRRVLL